MLKIPEIAFIREADAYTIAHEPIASIDLMERAATALFHRMVARLKPFQKVDVFCGSGNNGGDGLVLARLLQKGGFSVRVFLLMFSEKGSPDFETNLQRLHSLSAIEVHEMKNATDFPAILTETLVVDALLGSGLNKPAAGIVAELIGHLNSSGALIVAVDVPSGLFADQPLGAKDAVVKADFTYTFEWPKQAFFFPENEFFVGNWEVVPIGLHSTMHHDNGHRSFLVEKNDIVTQLRPRPRFAHKGNFGHALLLAGASDKAGAAVLAAKACMRSGAGLLHVHLPEKAVLPMQIHLPEAMISVDVNADTIEKLPDLQPYSAIAMGPGVGTSQATASVLKLLIQNADRPLVLDADALNILSENKTWLSFLPKESILTPHPKEFERLVGKWSNGFERLETQREFSRRFGVYVLLKGAFTTLSTPGGPVFFNPTGNPGMATAGSGDVLCGVLLGLMSQGYSPFHAALIGVYLHGLAGDMAAKAWGMEAMLASDIIEKMGEAFASLQN